MKILILANNDIGLYQFRRELIGALREENTVVLSLPYGEMVEPLKAEGCKFIDTAVDRRGVNPITDLKLFFQYRRILKKEQPDLVITYTIKPNIYGGFACRLCNVPYAVNITGLGTAFQGKGLLRAVVTFLYKLGTKRAKVVFFENMENQQIFVDEGIVPAEKTCLLPGAGVNLEHYQVLDYPDSSAETRFLFIGRVMKEKGINELFSAMRRLHQEGYNCVLDVLGGFEEDYKQQIQQYAREGWLYYHGYQKDVRPFIAASHCFVLPSWHEGMANTNLECAASGRPVITSNIHGCKEAVVEGVSGLLCERKSSESLYQTMKTFLSLSHEERRQMGLAGRRHTEDVFDKRKVVERTLESLGL